MESLLITGATGFIGRSLVSRLDPRQHQNIYCLSRTGLPGPLPQNQVIRGSLGEPDTYADALASCRTVIHLAALTGHGTRDQFLEINTRGTEKLIDQCERSGVENLLYASTIAVKYQDQRNYYYAQSKALAEQAVKASRLHYLIVRPTIVIGPGGGVWSALASLARRSVILLPGDGRTQIQPVALDDLTAVLQKIMSDRIFTNRTIELGGPEIISFEQFLKKIHLAQSGKDPLVWHLPIKPLIAALSLMEKLSPLTLPVGAGQLAAFWQDSTADNGDPGERAGSLAALRVTGVDQMIEGMLKHE